MFVALSLLACTCPPGAASAQTPACDELSRSQGTPDSAAVEGLRRLGECLSQALDYGADQLERSLPILEREVARLEADVRHQLPILRDRLEALQRRLEEALRTPTRPRDDERPQRAAPHSRAI